MAARQMTQLTRKQINAIVILMGFRHLPVSEKTSSPEAINRTTAWGLEEHGLASCEYHHRHGERVKLLPRARQLIEVGRKIGRR